MMDDVGVSRLEYRTTSNLSQQTVGSGDLYQVMVECQIAGGGLQQHSNCSIMLMNLVHLYTWKLHRTLPLKSPTLPDKKNEEVEEEEQLMGVY